MATFTAQILVGTTHTYHGGIKPSHSLYLSENGRLGWVMMPTMPLIDPEWYGQMSLTVWLAASSESALDDGLLMAAVCAIKIPEVVAVFQDLLPAAPDGRVNLGDLTREQREFLYAMCHAFLKGHHLVISVLSDSSIRRAWQTLQAYGTSMELCTWSHAKAVSKSGLREFTPKDVAV